MNKNEEETGETPRNEWNDWNDTRPLPLDPVKRDRREVDARSWLSKRFEKSETESWAAAQSVDLISRVLIASTYSDDGHPAHLDPADLAAAMNLIGAARRDIDKIESQLIMVARHQKLPWRFIAEAMGMQSPQSAAQRWQRLSSADAPTE